MALNTADKRYSDKTVVGLAENANGVRFHCGSCEYFDNGTCHNKNPKLNGREVKAEWCCNLYDHPGMRIVVK